MLAWLDIETDGLDPRQNTILEIGFIITDDDLNEIARRAWVLPYGGEVDDFIAKMHGPEGSGLLEDCRLVTDGFDSAMSYLVHDSIVGFLRGHLGAEKPPLCGSSVDFDRGFLRASGIHLVGCHMNIFAPLLDLFHYRVIDVSTVKEMARRWAPSVYESRPKPGARHRALPDLEDTIAEAKHYKKWLFDAAKKWHDAEKFDRVFVELQESLPPGVLLSPEEIVARRREIEQRIEKEGK